MFGKKSNEVLSPEEQNKIRWAYENFLSGLLNEAAFTDELYIHLRDNSTFRCGSDKKTFFQKRFQGYDNVKETLEEITTAQHHSNPDYKELNTAIALVTTRYMDNVVKFSAEMEAIPVKIEIEMLQKKLADLMKKAS